MRSRFAILVWLAGGLGFVGLGCGTSTTPSPPAPKDAPTVGPHQGTAFALPNGSGLVEIVNEPEPSDRGKAASTAIVAYFLQPDGRTALSPAPTNVKVRLDVGKDSAANLDLKPEPKSGDPASAARFTTKTGPYALPDIRGELSATVGGSDFKAVLSGVR